MCISLCMFEGLPKPWNWRYMRLPLAGGTLGTWWILGVVPSAGRRALGQVRSIMLRHTKTQSKQQAQYGTDQHRWTQIRDGSSLLPCAGTDLNSWTGLENVSGCVTEKSPPSPSQQQQQLLGCKQTRPSLKDRIGLLVLLLLLLRVSLQPRPTETQRYNNLMRRICISLQLVSYLWGLGHH